MQKYIVGKSASLTFVRVSYDPVKQLSVGCCWENILHSFDEVKSMDGKLNKFFAYPESYETAKCFGYKGGSLPILEREIKKIYNFLLYDIGLRITELTVDFMRGEDDRIWFLNLQSYTLVDTHYSLKQQQMALSHEEIEEQRRIRKEEAENSVFCRMCGLRCRVPELNKRLTLKMMYNVKEHLEKRGINIYNNLKGDAPETMTHTVKVCTTCYSIAIAEYDLIETECKLAQIQGIPATVDTIMVKANKTKGESNAIMDPFLHQWRIMVHIEELFDIPPATFFEKTDYQIQYKVFDYSIGFPMAFENKPVRMTARTSTAMPSGKKAEQNIFELPKSFFEKTSFSINKLRTIYFFSPTYNLDDFLKCEPLMIRITEGDDWEKDLVSGNSNIFADCTTCDYVNNCVRYSKEVMLFKKTNVDQMMKLKVNIGLLRGKKVDTSMIQMNPYSTYSIYFPPASYLSSEEFPFEWMEIFEVFFYFCIFQLER